MTDEAQTAFEQVVAEHEELRSMIQELREFLDEPRPEVTEDRAHPWAETLAHRLLTLHGKLALHFREEERSGMMEELAVAFPRAIPTLKALEGEHESILGDIRRLVNAALTYAEARPVDDPSLRQRTGRLLKRLTKHEERETDLIERLYCEDLGTVGA